MVMCAVMAALVMRPGFAENIIFPHVKSGITDASGIVDVSLPPYSADRTGKTDVTLPDASLIRKRLQTKQKEQRKRIFLPGNAEIIRIFFI
jgi:hypothetical protein